MLRSLSSVLLRWFMPVYWRAANGLGRASYFVEGNFIDTERAPPIPPEFVGRMLSPIEARQLQEMLDSPPDHGTERRRKSKPARPQNQASPGQVRPAP
jgi:hypothetical protein